MKAVWFKLLKQAVRERRLTAELSAARAELVGILENQTSHMPVLLVSYNNAAYLDMSIEQLNRRSIVPIVLDNCSGDPRTRELLQSLVDSTRAHVIRLPKNYGHMVGFLTPIYTALPENFAYSDPDLLYNKHLPNNFLEQLAELNTQFAVFKSGFALDLKPGEEVVETTIERRKVKPIPFQHDYSIREWEAQYWRFKLDHSALDVFASRIDTTFAVYSKSNYRGDFFDALRVGGDFACVHMPWFPARDVMTETEKMNYLAGNSSTSWVKQ